MALAKALFINISRTLNIHKQLIPKADKISSILFSLIRLETAQLTLSAPSCKYIMSIKDFSGLIEAQWPIPMNTPFAARNMATQNIDQPDRCEFASVSIIRYLSILA